MGVFQRNNCGKPATSNDDDDESQDRFIWLVSIHISVLYPCKKTWTGLGWNCPTGSSQGDPMHLNLSHLLCAPTQWSRILRGELGVLKVATLPLKTTSGRTLLKLFCGIIEGLFSAWTSGTSFARRHGSDRTRISCRDFGVPKVVTLRLPL